MHFSRVAAIGLSLLLLCRLVTAQALHGYSVTTYNSDNGLPQTSVGQIAMDKNGFLWVATQGGLVRFDGARFVTYNRLNVPSLTSNRILKVGLRSDSLVYFSDENANLYSFDHRNEAVKLSYKDYNTAITVQSPTRHVNIIENLEEGSRKKVKACIPPEQTLILFLPTKKNEGYLWVHNKMLFYISGNKVRTSINVSEGVKGRLMSNFGMLRDTLYCTDINSRLIRVDGGGVQTEMSLKLSDNGQWRSESTTGLRIFRSNGKMYLFTKGRLYEAVTSKDNTLYGTPRLDLGTIDDISAYHYFPDKGVHVIGSRVKGLMILKPKQFRTVTAKGSDNIYYAQETLGPDAVLTTQGIVSSSGNAAGVPVKMVGLSGMLREPDGGYWVSTQGPGIVRMDSRLNVTRRIKNKIAARIFRRTADGHIWISTFHNGFGRISGDSIVWSKLRVESPRLNFIPTGNHTFWMSDGQGLFHYNELSGKKTIIKRMAGKEVREFYTDQRKTLWLGTYGDGFYAICNGKLRRLPIDPNGYLLFVHSFLEDGNGFLWMTTNHGMFKCKMQDLYDYMDGKSKSVYYYYYDKSDGFSTNEFNGGYPPSGIVLANGNFSFPSMEGLVQFHPDSIKDVLPSSDIFIDNVTADGKKIFPSKSLEFEPTVEHVEITAVSPYFGLPENQSLEYMIQGLSERWYPVNSNGTIVLNRLAHGSYVLKVRKHAGFGRESEKVLTQRIKVHPFWYQTWYFRVLLTFVLIGTVYAIIRLRYRLLIRSKQTLEKQVRERTRELEHSNRLKARITSLLAHDLQSPIYFLNTLAEYISSAVDRNEYQNLSRGAYEIRSAAVKMHAFVKEINLWNKSQQDGFYITKTVFLFDEVMIELKTFFDELLVAKGNTLHIEYPDQQMVYSNQDILKAVLRNLIDNANKNTANGDITVKLLREEDKLFSVTVSDNGRGMSAAELKNMQVRIENMDSTARLEPSVRLGYQIIIDFANLLECRLHLDSREGLGTSVKLSGLQAAVTSAMT